MKPARFDYYDPRTLSEALELLQKHQADGKILSGGQSLMPLLNMRLVRPKVVVDINRVEGLSSLQTWDGGISIGARVPLRALEREKLIAERLPILRDAAQHIGHPQIRNRGTICGSIAHADPAAELPALALALDAELVASSSKGTRAIPAESFFTSYFTTSLEPHEILTETRFPAPPKGMVWSVLEVSRRHGDFALAGVVVGLSLDKKRSSVTGARVVCFGVGPAPVRVKEAEDALVGQPPGEETFRGAGEVASRGLDPDNDVHATAEYRRAVAGTLVRRALLQAWQKSGGK